MPYAPNRTTASGTTATFALTFPYLDRTHIYATVNGTPVTITDFPSEGTVTLAITPAPPSSVEIGRRTPTAQMVVFTPGNLASSSLNIESLQALYILEEEAWGRADLEARAIRFPAGFSQPELDPADTTLRFIAGDATGRLAGADGAALAQLIDSAALELVGVGMASYQLKVGDAGALTTLGRGAGIARDIQTRLREHTTLFDYGGVGDGVTNDTAAFTAANADSKTNAEGTVARPVDLCGRTWAITTLPDYISGADLREFPRYYNGKFKEISTGRIFPVAASPGGCLTYDTVVPEEVSSRDRVAILASIRAKATPTQTSLSTGNPTTGSRVAMVATDRCMALGTNNIIAGASQTDLTGAYNNMSAANRFCEVNGQVSVAFTSLLSRTFGVDPYTDFEGRWGLTGATGGPFFNTGRPTSEDPHATKDCFYNTIIGSRGVDITGGSQNFALGSRADATTGTIYFQTIENFVLEDSGNGVVGCRNKGHVGGNSNVAVASSSLTMLGGTTTGMLASTLSTLQNCKHSAIIASTSGRLLNAGSGSNNKDAHALLGTSGCRAGRGWYYDDGGVEKIGGPGATAEVPNIVDNRGAVVIGSVGTANGASWFTMVGSRNCENSSRTYGIGGGYHADTITPTGLTNQNMTWRINSIDGSTNFNGTVGTSGADYAELRELGEGVTAFEPGEIVVRIAGSRKVRRGVAGDAPSRILGVVSVRPGLIGNADSLEYAGRYVTDVWGRRLLKSTVLVSWAPVEENVPATGDSPGVQRIVREGFTGTLAEAQGLGLTIPADAAYETINGPTDRPDYDPTLPHVPRQDRPDEWVVVGMMGQLPVRFGATAEVDGYLTATGAFSPVPTRLVLEEIIEPYDEARGYGVGWCSVG